MIARPTPDPRPRRVPSLLILAFALAAPGLASGDDRLKELQTEAVARKGEKVSRPYHFGSQGAGDVFSNHASHSNRLIPFYTFGRKVDPSTVTGANSVYRDPEKLRKLYGFLPERTLNPTAEYADQSDLYRIQREAVDRGVKYLFLVWFDGMDWEATRAAAIARSGKVYSEGKGSGLTFLDFTAEGSAKFGFYVTSPTHDKNTPDVDTQTVKIPADALPGGYDPTIAGPNPWTLGPLGPKAPGYLKGQSGDKKDQAGVREVGGVLHAYTDSAPSAAEAASGVKSYNNGINVAEDGRFVPTLFQQLQDRGWKVGTVTSVTFDHASPAAMYAHNVNRDDYQDLGRDMLGLPSIAQLSGREPKHTGLDVVMGAGMGLNGRPGELGRAQGKNAVEGNAQISDADKAAVDVKNGGAYVVAQTEPGVSGSEGLSKAARQAAAANQKLFGLYGKPGMTHLPYRTADGQFDPAPGLSGKAESYTPADRLETPSLVDFTNAAITVLSAKPGQPFALFVEAGDVDFALHDNNLDNAVGAVISGDDAVRAIIAWVEAHSNWDDAALIVAADHGHYLVLDDPAAIAGAAK